MSCGALYTRLAVGEDGRWQAQLVSDPDDPSRPEGFNDTAWARALEPALEYQRSRGGGTIYVSHVLPATKPRE